MQDGGRRDIAVVFLASQVTPYMWYAPHYEVSKPMRPSSVFGAALRVYVCDFACCAECVASIWAGPVGMMKSALTSICPFLIIVAAAVAALYRRIRRIDALPGNRNVPLLPIYSWKAARPASRQNKEALVESQEREVVVVLGTSSARIGSAGGFAERGATSEFEVSPGDSASTVTPSHLRTSTRSADSLSSAESAVLVQQVTEDVLLPHPQLPRIRVS